MRTTATAHLAATETTVADEVTTSASGAYNLSLDPGDYVVCEVSKAAPPLWQQSQPANTACEAIDGLEPGGHAVSVQSGQQLDEGNFGNWRQGDAPGFKFNDLNRDGDRDLGEDGLEGWTIRAYEDDGDGTLAATETTVADEVTTSASGAYNLSLDPGDYVVCEVSKAAPPLWQQSQPANTACEAIDGLEPGGHAVSVQSGQQLDEGNFGNYIEETPDPTVTLDKKQQNLTTGGAPGPGLLAVELGDRIRYTVTVTASSTPVNDVQVADKLSRVATSGTIGLELQQADSRCAEPSGQPPVPGGTFLRCDLGDLSANEEVKLVIEAKVVDSRCTIVGTRNNDGNAEIGGTAGDDIICGAGGSDTSNAGTGNDTMYGNQPGLVDTTQLRNEAWIDLDGNDSATGDESAATVLAQPEPSDDGADTLVGELGNDTLLGQDEGDILRGGDGADVARGEAGADDINGDAGNDVLFGEADNDTLRGGTGSDRAFGGDGADTIVGQAGNDPELRGGDGADIINGDDGNDVLFGEADNDTLRGGTESDRAFGGDGADTIVGQAGNDPELRGGDGADIINGDDGNDVLFGEADNDTLRGGTESDRAFGGDGADTIVGQAGNAPGTAGRRRRGHHQR